MPHAWPLKAGFLAQTCCYAQVALVHHGRLHRGVNAVSMWQTRLWLQAKDLLSLIGTCVAMRSQASTDMLWEPLTRREFEGSTGPEDEDDANMWNWMRVFRMKYTEREAARWGFPSTGSFTNCLGSSGGLVQPCYQLAGFKQCACPQLRDLVSSRWGP